MNIEIIPCLNDNYSYLLHEEVSSKLNAQAYCGRHPFGWEKEVPFKIKCNNNKQDDIY